MPSIKKLPTLFLITGVCCALALKLWNSQADFAAMHWLVSPVNTLVHSFTGADYITTAIGFEYPNAGIRINQACSGVNIFAVLILALTWAFYRETVIQTKTNLFKKIMLVLLISYMTCIAANTSRILFEWMLGSRPGFDFLNHTLRGAFVYTTYLTLAYIAVTFYIRHNSKSHVILS